ncbi:MAG: hypothetical protein A3B69_05100 [Gammaproteobacteria bacterium RIFCSPHIGHO2_02_FULL_38_33]|nr:MAG: hypothetical protein A3B69_05100 [Gammaproteobacteria bacterium RIFCSPHIGHO2_02_FULL_38_33]OGT23156.1 MAG: hypothetical protein A2W47_06950 [Gammaproteobacteria bacterium RIFCSPHIGHO2_12_38_15]
MKEGKKVSSFILYSEVRGVARVTLNHPQKRNVLGEDLLRLFLKKLKEIKKNKAIHVLVLAGEGKCFCAGADLSAMQALSEASLEENKKDALLLAQVLYELCYFPKPVLALVHGFAFGGALGLLSCCDMVIAHPKTEFGFSEVRWGLAPAVISPYVISAIGERQARRYFLTAERFSAETAKDLGLVNLVTEKIEALSDDYIKMFLENSPAAMAVTKKIISSVVTKEINQTLIKKTVNLNAKMRTSPDGRAGLKAFSQKTKTYLVLKS